MNDSTFDLEGVRQQQVRLRQHGRLHWVHWLILTLSLVITVVAWHFSQTMLDNRAAERLQRESDHVIEQIKVHLSHYEDALRSGAAMMKAYNGNLSRDLWKTYTTSLELTTRYPGVNGIGIIREISSKTRTAFESKQQRYWPGFQVHPPHNHQIKLPIVYIEPLDDNASTIGLDIAFETNRREAALLARNLGVPQISGPVALVEEAGEKTGFLFFMPYYLDTVGFDGLVYAPLEMNKFIEGSLGEKERHVIFSINDDNTLIYDELGANNIISDKLSSRIESTESFYGRQWHFTITPSEAFSELSGTFQPFVVLISGIMIDVMLLVLFLVMTRSNSKIISLADILINRLGKQTSSLTQKNNELESFAHIVSHDLKTPIRAIQSLSSFIEDDIEELVSTESTKGLIREHTRRINEQVVKSDALIKGILNFSIVGQVQEAPENTDIKALIIGICQSLDIPIQQVCFTSPMPTFQTYTVSLTQVFENLLGNAYKYHPEPENAQIVISEEENESFHRFFVADNGAGIEPKYRTRVFEPFVTLQVRPDANSSGIGLSIVKKSVDALGGNIGIADDYSDGVKFYFDWPKHVSRTIEDIKNAA